MLGAVALRFGTAMHHQFTGAGLLHRIGDFKFSIAAIPAETHFYRHRQMRRYRGPHRFRALIDEFGIFEQCRAAAAAVHHF
ncbi:Uncharacterised protein [Salmonella enterica subsp. enterica serovar Bovismorbificans]|uniref:Uncharacterized protein n=1 Tax=Salmonella enterica subsp. enterica serovar Bovismorbificans TaxID=58097 RepID=A0A655D1Y8_SALET|nr:Uncharacterised protein [Salmonella enterica subsp. enterica serovar Bovismorbificans]CPR43282.1 Uncharacterised protein [Salmonella enterica subsp. enterica serovar Bovismorbificans]